MDIDKHELAILESIGAGRAGSQRSLSQKAGLSLGSTNVLLRRLIRKGCVKAKALDRRSVQYILTPSGAAEKMRKVYAYTLKTLQAHQVLQARLENVLRKEIAAGRRSFTIVGSGELSDLLELVLEKIGRGEVSWSRGAAPEGSLVLRVSPERVQAPDTINILDELSKGESA